MRPAHGPSALSPGLDLAQVLRELPGAPRTLAEAVAEENTPVLVTTVDERVISTNNAWVELCGYLPSEALGRTPKELLKARPLRL